MAKKPVQKATGNTDLGGLMSAIGNMASAMNPIDKWSDSALLKAIANGDQKKEAIRELRTRHGDSMRLVVDDSGSSLKVLASETEEMNEWVHDSGGQIQHQWAGNTVMTLADFTGAVVQVNPYSGQPMPPGDPWSALSEDLQALMVLARLRRTEFPDVAGADQFMLLGELKAAKDIKSLKTHPRWGGVARYALLPSNKQEFNAAKDSLTMKKGGVPKPGIFFRPNDTRRDTF